MTLDGSQSETEIINVGTLPFPTKDYYLLQKKTYPEKKSKTCSYMELSMKLSAALPCPEIVSDYTKN